MLQALIAQLNGGGDPSRMGGASPEMAGMGMPSGMEGMGMPGAPGGMQQEDSGPGEDHSESDWLTTAINAVHGGMVQERDPKIVSLLGAIINQLTTVQERVMQPQQGGMSG